MFRAQQEPNGNFLYLEAEISLDFQGGSVGYEEREHAAVLKDEAGDHLSSISAYVRSEALGGRYVIHSGAVHDDEQSADVFAITDPIETVLALMAGAGCLAMYGSQIWLVHETIDGIKAAGLAPRLRIKSSFLHFVTCRFEVNIVPHDIKTGISLPPITINIGPKKKK